MSQSNPPVASEDVPFPVQLTADHGSFRAVQDTRHPDSHSHFEFALPANWVQIPTVDLPPTVAGFVEFCRFASRDNPTIQAGVARALLPRECGPGDWLNIEISGRGETVISRRDAPQVGGQVSDVLAKASDGMIRRYTAIKDGNRIFLIFAQADPGLYPELAETLLAILTSFKLLSPEGRSFAESLVEFTIPQNDSEPLHFKCPESWHLSQLSDNLTTAASELGLSALTGLELDSESDGHWTGSLRVIRLPRRRNIALKPVMEWYLHCLRKDGLAFTATQIIEIQPAAGIKSGQILIPQSVEDAVYEAPFLFADLGPCHVLAGIVTTRQADALAWWAINMRAFEILRDTLSCP